eukprot:TRINITY_DN12897_c0_g1_i1.p1 TRINITY_DN12897_c0_g1~~TRINITY_DN12897_c0_g1_i1.p1  ORF type:complete len:442 (+),score=70.23 TRINITY_DN12897_c0_g1_i1:160-1485(+)
MIEYNKGYAGLRVIFRYGGAAWPSGILPGLLSSSVGLLIGQMAELNEVVIDRKEFIDHLYPFQFFAFIVGFCVVFRTNYAYQRYWEAYDAVQRMGAKWFDGACMAVAFDAPGDRGLPYLATRDHPMIRPPEKAGMPHDAFYNELLHLFSLNHALALQHLRSDSDLGNLEALQITADHDTMKSKVSAESMQYRLTYVGCKLPKRDEKGAPRSKACCGFRYTQKHLQDVLKKRKLRILGQITDEELLLLRKDSQGNECGTLVRIAMVRSWIMRRLISRQKYEPQGDLGVTSPPIVSRFYQVYSDGFLGFSQAAKVTDCPFPFPYHNFIRIVLIIHALICPWLVNAKLMHAAVRFVVNFLAVWAYFALCEVGDNLEDPFLPYDPNELPLQEIQHTFNARLLSLGMAPQSYTWLGPGSTPAMPTTGGAESAGSPAAAAGSKGPAS